jgi:hypothetical protein
MTIADSRTACTDEAGTAVVRLLHLRARFGECRAIVLAVSALALAAGTAGFGGSSDNGVAAKSPDAIVAAATNTVDSIKSVHVAGSGVSGGAPLAFDLNLAAGKGGSGEISQNGVSARLVVVDNEVYLNGNDAFWRQSGPGGAAVPWEVAEGSGHGPVRRDRPAGRC